MSENRINSTDTNKDTLTDSQYRQFLAGRDTLQVYNGEKMVFSSQKSFLLPLLDFLHAGIQRDGIYIFDRVIGNAAALLLVPVKPMFIFSPTGSEYAKNTLYHYTINFRFDKVVPSIRNRAGTGMCPMEELSLTRGINADNFYDAVISRYMEMGLLPSTEQ